MGKTTYLIGIILTILIGTYFYMTCCSSCAMDMVGDEPIEEQKTVAPVAPQAMSYPFSLSAGEASINLTIEQRQKVADISRYLDKVEKSKCEVIGHTDSQCRRKTNMKLGQERANFAKAYLVQNGISENRIKPDSKGPKDPIASYDTDEGRAKNRRIEISIK